MQLIIITAALVFVMFVNDLKAQLTKTNFGQTDSLTPSDALELQAETYAKADWKKIDIDFLSSYYEQDGNNGAVTGGIGTERLTDFTQKLNVSFATSERLKWNIDTAYDYYSSASTDNINSIRSSDSESDVRYQLNVGLDYSLSPAEQIGFRIGSSAEYDYTSFNAGFQYNKLSNGGNTSFGVSGQAFYDTWMLIYPRELRGEVRLPTKKRQSYNLAFNVNQVVNKKMHISLMAESTFMTGLLSTPFHRVYFQNRDKADIERLPDQRLKIPLGIRANTYISERLILRSYYRYYWDNWGMTGHTASLELPIKINRFFALYPHYRYHTQSAIDHFNGFREHQSSQEFYTSDYDLSELHSHTFGIGILYGKSDGIASMKIPFTKSQISIESIDLKYSHFDRSTGLHANIISLGFRFSL